MIKDLFADHVGWLMTICIPSILEPIILYQVSVEECHLFHWQDDVRHKGFMGLYWC